MGLWILGSPHVNTPQAVGLRNGVDEGSDAVVAAVGLVELVRESDFGCDVLRGEWLPGSGELPYEVFCGSFPVEDAAEVWRRAVGMSFP